jgi:uncharacterized protein YceH (UPF0502 family)
MVFNRRKSTPQQLSLGFRHWIIAGLLGAFLIIAWQSWLPVQADSNLESRISRLEFDNNSLRSRLSRLESDIDQLAHSAGSDLPVRIIEPPSETPSTQPSEQSSVSSPSNPMFDRLATLVIELRDRIIALEEKIAELQGQ